MVSREIWNIFMFFAEEEERGAWLPTMGSIYYPGTALSSYVVYRQRNMPEMFRKNSIRKIINLRIAHGCIAMMTYLSLFIISIFCNKHKKDQRMAFLFGFLVFLIFLFLLFTTFDFLARAPTYRRQWLHPSPFLRRWGPR